MHADEARNHRVAGQVEHLGILGHGPAHRLDLAMTQNECLVLARWSSCTVNDANVGESYDRRIEFDEFVHLGREGLA